MAGCQEQRFIDDFPAVVREFEPALRVDLEGELIEGVFARDDVLVEKHSAAAKFAHSNSEKGAPFFRWP